MPALPNVPNVLRVDLQWNDGTDTNVSTRLFFEYSGTAPVTATCVSLAADIYGDAVLMAGLWSEHTDLVGVKVTDLSSSSGGVGEHAQSTAGTNAGTDLAGGTAALVNYVIARRYRGGKPRSYFPFGTADDLASRQQWGGTFVTAVDSQLATFFGSVIGTTVSGTTITNHVNVSYYDGFTVVTNPITGRAKNVSKLRTSPVVDTILSYAASSRPGSQRRRN